MKPWMDLVVATPTLGVTFVPTWRTAQEVLAAIRPVLLDNADASDGVSKMQFNVRDPFSVEATIPNGLSFTLTHNQVVCTFRYSVEVEDAADEVARLKFARGDSAAVPVTELIADVAALTARLLGLCAGLEQEKVLKVVKIGVLMSGRIPKNQMVPGFNRYWKHLAQGMNLIDYEGNALASISGVDENRTQCHHFLKIEETQDLATIRLDWQQRFPKAAMKASQLASAIDAARKSAIGYFIEFGENGLELPAS